MASFAFAIGHCSDLLYVPHNFVMASSLKLIGLYYPVLRVRQRCANKTADSQEY